MRLIYDGQSKEVQISEPKKSILKVFLENFECSFSSCAKSGTCGRCRVRIIEGEAEISETDKRFFTSEELGKGFRLACQTLAEDSFVVEADFIQNQKIEITTIDYVNQDARGEQTHTEKCDKAAYAVAIDLGTTTIGFSLLSVADGESHVMDSLGSMNPERSFGADVISRIEKANEGYLSRMQVLVRNAIRKGIELLISRNGLKITDVKRIVLAGNTTMLHILMGQSCRTLGKSPFIPVTLQFQQLNQEILGEKCTIEILPGLSAFVGADIAAGLYALDFANRTKKALLIDLGTNGEMAVGNREKILCTATAAGSAFEGDITANLPGTDMIALIGTLLEQKIIDESGLLAEGYFEEGYPAAENVRLTQKHIRDIQAAKAAIYCGVKSLLREAALSVDEIDEVFLAGGFGQKLSVEMAVRIGLLPKELNKKIAAVGNTSLAGCRRFAEQENAKEEIDWILSHTRVMNLAETASFQTEYIEAMNFPKKWD